MADEMCNWAFYTLGIKRQSSSQEGQHVTPNPQALPAVTFRREHPTVGQVFKHMVNLMETFHT